MSHFKIRYISLLIVLLLLVTACAPAVTEEPTPVPDTEEPTEATEPTEKVEIAVPTELKIAIANQDVIEQPWNSSLVKSVERLIEEKPHNLNISYTFEEEVAEPDAERVMREFASSGEYGIIISHGVYPDAVAVLMEEFPDIVWAGMGSGGWEGMGDNMYWFDIDIHEPAYLAGMVAGGMTKTNVISAVGSFPYPTVNAPINAFFDGARAVNKEIETRNTYIESWWDPSKAREAAAAQIAAGSDVIYAERFGPFEACAEEGVYAIGHYDDQYELAPDVVLTSTIARWDPTVRYMIDEWWNHVVDGVPYDAPVESIVFSMAEGGSGLAPFHKFKDVIPDELQEKVEDAKRDIMNGTLKVPYNGGPIE